MAKKFLHVSFDFADGDPKIEKLVTVFDRAIDWFRYSPNCWIVWTSSDVEKWYRRLRPLIDDGDTMFIVRIDIDERQGWVSNAAWDWINKSRAE